MTAISGKIVSINGPIVRAEGLTGISMLDIAEVGHDRLIGEVIKLDGNISVIQVYEDNTGLRPGDDVISSGMPLSVMLGPGLLGEIYDGMQRPLVSIAEISGNYIKKGAKSSPLKTSVQWKFSPRVKDGDEVKEGDAVGEVRENRLINHSILVPPGVSGIIKNIAPEGNYTVDEQIYTVETAEKGEFIGKMAVSWPVRKQRPYRKKIKSREPLITGQRVIDTFFPIAKGGTAAIPGGFGTGKTMIQHALARWSDADIIVYIGCGERGNEMTDVLNEFPRLTDPRTGSPLMERTIMIANTSNMPVPAREVSIYTGVTIAEYYRDMGYSVAVMADSTSRWAEALRELSGRLGDMPAEEGFPSYLATRLAEFYERAGMVETLSGDKGSITIIGAVSPPGGDFSEPVTQHTTRFIRCFWALDRILADARHYPSISWVESYSEYLADVINWWQEIDIEWNTVRQAAMNILLEEDRLQKIVKIVGPDSLPPLERFVLFCAEIIKNGFLQQNSFDPVDVYCSPVKQFALLELIVHFYRQGSEYISLGADIGSILTLESVSELSRLKSEKDNDQGEKLNEFRIKLDTELLMFKRVSSQDLKEEE